MEDTSTLCEFLAAQKVLQIAPAADEPWIANVLYVADGTTCLYFVGNTERMYARQLLADPRLSFATAWVADNDHLNRKGVQGVGTASVLEDVSEIRKAIELHNQKFIDFKDQVTEDEIRFDSSSSCIWCIKPEFIKFWNDEEYGLNGSEKFNF